MRLLALWPERKQIKSFALDRNIAFPEAGSVIMLHFRLEWFCLQNVTLREKCPNTELFLVRIQSECEKTRTRNNSIFGHFSRSVHVGDVGLEELESRE